MLDDWMDDFGSFGGNPLYLAVTGLLIAAGRKEGWTLLYGFGIAVAIVYLLRFLHFKKRPKKKKFTNLLEKLDANSFISGHATKATMLAGVLGGMYLDPLPWGIITICWLFACFNRVEDKKHHLSDVVLGVVLGVLTIVGLNYYLLA